MSTLKVNQITDLNNAEIFEPNLMTAVSASGTSVDFTGIPSWVKRITVMFQGVSTNSTSPYIIRIGDGAIVSTSYTCQNTIAASGSTFVSDTTGFLLTVSTAYTDAASVHSGIITISNITSNTWVASGIITRGGGGTFQTAGHRALTNALDRVRITTVNGTDTFDAGTINVMYE